MNTLTAFENQDFAKLLINNSSSKGSLIENLISNALFFDVQAYPLVKCADKRNEIKEKLAKVLNEFILHDNQIVSAKTNPEEKGASLEPFIEDNSFLEVVFSMRGIEKHARAFMSLENGFLTINTTIFDVKEKRLKAVEGLEIPESLLESFKALELFNHVITISKAVDSLNSLMAFGGESGLKKKDLVDIEKAIAKIKPSDSSSYLINNLFSPEKSLNEESELEYAHKLMASIYEHGLTQKYKEVFESLALFSHSNRHIDGRNSNTKVNAEVEFIQPMSSEDNQQEALNKALKIGGRDVKAGHASHSNYLKTLINDYLMDGKPACLLNAILEKRLAGKFLAKALGLTELGADKPILCSLDKVLLMPSKGEYDAISPVQSVLHYPLNGIILESIGLKVHDSLEKKADVNISIKGSLSSINNAVNVSKIVSDCAGNFFKTRLELPNLKKGITNRYFFSKLITDQSRLVKALLGKIQVSNLKTYQAIANKNSISADGRNSKYKALAFEFGMEVGHQVKSALIDVKKMLIEGHKETDDTIIQKMLFDVELAFKAQGDLFKSIRALLSSELQHKQGYELIVDGDLHIILTGFNQAVASVIETNDGFSKKSKNRSSVKSRSFDSKHLVIRLSASDVNLGNETICSGTPSLIGIYGFLHNVIEREIPGLVIQGFAPVFHKINTYNQGKQFKVFIKKDGKVSKSQNLKSYAQAPNCHLAGIKGLNTVKGMTNTLLDDQKGTVSLSIMVELSNYLEDIVIEAISNKIESSRFLGGFINHSSVRVVEVSDEGIIKNAPMGYAYSEVDQESVEKFGMIDLAFVTNGFINGEYLPRYLNEKKNLGYPEYPTGLVLSGYMQIGVEANKACLKGTERVINHVEALYTSVRFAFFGGDKNQVKWFKYKYDASEKAYLVK